MLAEYVAFTNDTSILERALPLADVEFNFWTTNRTVSITSPYTNATHDVARYNGALPPFCARCCHSAVAVLTARPSSFCSLPQHRPSAGGLR
jgi:hypothetical protein